MYNSQIGTPHSAATRKTTVKPTFSQLWDRRRTLLTLLDFEFEAILDGNSPFTERDLVRWENELARINVQIKVRLS